jgi:Spherulation-specific family 4
MYRRIFLSFSLCLVMLFAFGAVSRFSLASQQSSTVVGVLVPLYTYPSDSSWSALIQAKESYPSVPVIAIINPDSGPGNAEDPNYATGIADLESAGITVLGYVATGYGTSSYSGLSNIEGQVSDYKSWYQDIQGIMFDEMSNSAAEQSYYQTLANYVSSLGMGFTAGNPGTTVATELMGIFDLLNIYENPGMPVASNINQYYSSFGNAGLSYIAYGVSSLPPQSTLQALDSYVSYIYVTNLGGANPYDGLPSYFAAELAALATVDGGKTTISVTSTISTTVTSVSSSSTSISSTTSTRSTTISTVSSTSTTTTLRKCRSSGHCFVVVVQES